MKAETNIVCAVKATYSDVYASIERAIALAGPSALANSQTIVLKLNLNAVRTPETGCTTHPMFVDGVLRYLREGFENLDIFVVESDATVTLADKFISWLGFTPVLEKWDAQFLNLSKIGVVRKEVGGRYLDEVPVPEIFERSDYFITLPKPKTNPITTITCCLKNQFGCLPTVEKSIYHPHLDDVIADVNSAIRPDLCLVDGIVAMGAQGPSFGVPIPLNAVICGKDPVAVDTFCARLMGFNPWFIGHIRKSARSGVGSMNYSVAGDKLDKVCFESSHLETWAFKVAGILQRQSQQRFRAQGRKSR